MKPSPACQAVCLFLFIFLVCPAAVQAENDGDRIVIGEDEIRSMHALGLPDVLNHFPGIQAGDSSVGIHGSYKVKVFLDGRPINDATSHSGGVNWGLVSPEDVEKIEILRGKGGMAYGQDASGGVILITTKRIRLVQGNVKLYGGNYTLPGFSANLRAGLKRLGLALNGTREFVEGYDVNNDKEREQAGLRLTYEGEQGNSVCLTSDYLHDERGLNGMPGYPTPFARKESRTSTQSLRCKLSGLISTTFVNDGRQHNTDPGRALDNHIDVLEMGEDLSKAFATGSWGEIVCGAGYRQAEASGSNFANQEERTVSAFAAQTIHRPESPWTFGAGMRLDSNSAFEDTVSPEVKVSYQAKAWRGTAAYSRTHNTPSFLQRYNETSSTRPNPDVGMETADNFSLTFFTRLHPDLTGEVNLFYNLLTDRITYVSGEDGVGQYQNFGRVSYAGGDLSVKWEASPSLTIKGAYTYLEAKDLESGLWLPSKARHRFDLNVHWRPSPSFSVAASAQCVSEVFYNKANTKTIPGYLIADLRAEYAFRRFTLFTEVENVMDQAYCYADGISAPPMTWIIGINIKI